MTTLTKTQSHISVPSTHGLGAGLARIVDGLVAGWRAAQDLKRLEARSDAALARQGMARNTLWRVLHERHFGF